MATATLTSKLNSRTAAPAFTTPADDFELARRTAEQDFVLLSDGETLRLAGILASEDSTALRKEYAYTLLHRALSPIALLAAREQAGNFVSFSAAHSAALISLWRVVHRWDPKRGMRLSAFVRFTLPVELERERKEAEAISRSDWSHIAVRAAIHEIIQSGHNRPFMTAYSDAQGETLAPLLRRPGLPAPLVLRFPAHTTVSLQAGLTVRIPPEKVENGAGKPQPNPLLSWFSGHKSITVRTFPKPRNWPRKTTRARTGYKVRQLQDAGEAFRSTVFGSKFTSRLMQTRVFSRPPRPIREEDVTPRMVQDVMRQNRKLKGQPFDEQAWSVARIGALMDELYTVTSYDVTIQDDEGDETRLIDFLAAPDQDDEEFPEEEFAPEQVQDAARITERLQKTGLWETAMRIPLHRFLLAYRAGRPGFCTLCSRYGIRVRHATEIMGAIEATLR